MIFLGTSAQFLRQFSPAKIAKNHLPSNFCIFSSNFVIFYALKIPNSRSNLSFHVLDSAMRKLFDFKLIFIAIFLLLTIAIKNSENFQLRDLNDGGSETNIGKGVSGKSTTKVRYPFRKLERSIEVDDDDDDDDDEDDDNDSEEDDADYKFAKVRKPSFEVKKRTNLRYSKLAQFRDPKDTQDDDDDDDDENESGEKVSFFSKVLNYFKSKPKDASDEIESGEKRDESAEASDDDDDDEEEKKPLLTEIFDKFKDFLDARNKQSKAVVVEVDDSDETTDSDDDSKEDDDKVDSELEKVEPKASESQIKSSIKETLATIFNRKPFNLIFDFDDDDEATVFEDSEEDEINYQRLLKEEQEHEREHTEQLIKPTSEEEPIKAEPEPEVKAPEIAEPQKAPPKPVVKREKKTREEAHLAQREFEKLLLNLPSFVPDYSKVRNPECQKQGEVFQRQLRGLRIWALQMMDANAKIPSGLMRGNTNQLGDFDSCTKISQKIKISDTNSMKMKGKYCLANIDVVAAADQLKLPVHLMQGRNFIRSTINDVSRGYCCRYHLTIN